MQKLVYLTVEFNDTNIQNIGKTIEEAISNSTELSEDEKTILLEYPVVYIHTWKNAGKTSVYVGETTNVIRRSEEHIRISDDPYSFDNVWQKNWKDEDSRERLSFFFSGRDMNKSLTLNIEDCLIRLMEECGAVTACNGRNNDQSNSFSNKYLTNDMVVEIWEILRTKVMDLPALLDDILNRLGKVNKEVSHKEEDSFVSFFLNEKIDPKTKFPEVIKNRINNNILLNYPVVYFHIWQINDEWHCYVGEANDLIKRTGQHWDNTEEDWHASWREALAKGNASMFAWSGNGFNKSVSLDLENRIMIYMTAHIGKKFRIENGRTNEQRKYGDKNKTYELLKMIVSNLHDKFPENFNELEKVSESAPFISSALLELNQGQNEAVEAIKNAVFEHLNGESKKKKLIIVNGGAGTGKTVVLSKCFFDIKRSTEREIAPCFVVNHQELFNVYTEQTEIWKIANNDDQKKCVFKAENLINNNSVSKDLLMVDEGHLLFSQKGEGKNISGDQLISLVKQFKVTVLVFDAKQFVESDKYWGRDLVWDNDHIEENFRNKIGLGEDELNVQVLNLEEQLRMTCANNTIDWLESFYKSNREGKYSIGKLEGTPLFKQKQSEEYKIYGIRDNEGYEVTIVESFDTLRYIINTLKKKYNPSAIVATYDWTTTNGYVLDSIPWHKKKNGVTIKQQKDFWTFDDVCSEIGSIHDIQGFDLNYVGVILGPTIKWDDEIGITYEKHKGKNMDCDDVKVLYPNEVGVLLTRGRKGIAIYACDKKLRQKLKSCVTGSNQRSDKVY